MKKNERMTWVKESGFIFAMIGSAVGFANILAFSAQCYKHGGGAFLIPFLSAVLIIGIPMLFLEGVIGNRYGLPIIAAYGHVSSPPWKIFGFIATLSCFTIGAFYSVLTAWSVAYAFFAGTNQIGADTGDFFQNQFLKDSGSLTHMGSISWTVLFFTVLVSIFTWLVLSKNIGKGVEKACSVFMPLLFFFILVFTVSVAFLPGALDGFANYLRPDFSKIWDIDLWRDVFGHVFFSFSLGIGIVVGYSRHTDKNTNIRRAMIFVALGDVIISLLAGFVIFGGVGFMSHETGIPFQEIVQSESTFVMGFIVFPQILQTFAWWIRPIIGFLFFTCVFIAGITGVFSIVEAVAGNIEVEFGQTRIKAVAITVVAMLFASVLFCLGNATHLLGALTPMVMGITFLIGGIGQIIVFMFMDKTVSTDLIWLSDNRRPKISFYLVKYVGFAFLLVSLFGALLVEFSEPFSSAHVVRWVWFAVVLLISTWAAMRRRA